MYCNGRFTIPVSNVTLTGSPAYSVSTEKEAKACFSMALSIAGFNCAKITSATKGSGVGSSYSSVKYV
ncbi:DUF1187 family protein [Latilactobacillus curvatus]|uniref:DUF1187 family protein n=1 Tax=Latilactobacillus curvatus TaxID=28038 RepID=A0A385ABW3_LATCU|nr:DUF1187 family protein [Latilactobacillus curvatus]MCT3525088.1 DUF1187 family protein [Latilactobacillus curvatus]